MICISYNIRSFYGWVLENIGRIITLKRSIWIHMIQFVELEIVLYVNCDYMYFKYV